MTDRGIIFSAPMVRALLDGRKTQTRRLATSPLRRCEVGDRLWVRETFLEGKGVGGYAPEVDPDLDPFGPTIDVIFRADDGDNERSAGPWKPAIHMPRRLSRLTLIVEAVKVEPLQAISAHDCYEEGIQRPSGPHLGSAKCAYDNARTAYRDLWQSLHGAGSWDANPTVVAITFRVERRNIDAEPEKAAA